MCVCGCVYLFICLLIIWSTSFQIVPPKLQLLSFLASSCILYYTCNTSSAWIVSAKCLIIMPQAVSQLEEQNQLLKSKASLQLMNIPRCAATCSGVTFTHQTAMRGKYPWPYPLAITIILLLHFLNAIKAWSNEPNWAVRYVWVTGNYPVIRVELPALKGELYHYRIKGKNIIKYVLE